MRGQPTKPTHILEDMQKLEDYLRKLEMDVDIDVH